MKLLIKRDQKEGGIFGGKITFSLYTRAELTKEEQENVNKYKMGSTVLATNLPDVGSDVLSTIPLARVRFCVTINSLVEGDEISCNDIIDMIDLEKEIKESCQVFKNILDTAAQFGGEEIVEF